MEPDDHLAVEGFALSRPGPDGAEEVLIGLRIAADLDHDERALAIEESLEVAKARLGCVTYH